MKINIVYEINNREYINCVLLERELVRRGHKVRIYNKQEEIAIGKPADVTIIPNSYRTQDVDYYQYLFNANNNLMIIYPCEQVTNYTLPKFFDYTSSNKAKMLPHMCWGKDYYNFIKSLGFDMTFTKITGAIQLDLSRKEFACLYHSKKEFAEEFKLPAQKKWIMFISDFVYISEQKVRTSIGCGESDSNELWERHEFEKKTRNELLKWFKTFLDTHNDYIIIYRKHPVEMLTEDIQKFIDKNKDNFYAISKYSIKEWIFNVDYITSWDSTTVVECIAAGKKMALLRPFDFVKKDEIQEYSFYKDYCKIRNYDDFENSMIKGIPDYTKGTLDEVEKLYSIESRLSVQRMADAIEQTFKEWQPQKKKNSKMFFFKRWLFIFKRMLPFKMLIKAVYKALYINFGFSLSSPKETKLAIIEWEATANNKKKHSEIALKIDRILKQKTNER